MADVNPHRRMAAEAQQRNPEFLFPKPLPANIKVRTCERKAEPPYADGLLGVLALPREAALPCTLPWCPMVPRIAC